MIAVTEKAATERSTSIASGSMRFWRVLQFAVLLVGLTIFGFLVFAPPIGVMMFWNFLIPVAPALLAVGAGAWRNVCPLATTALLPDRLGLSRGLKPSPALRDALVLVGVVALIVIVPLRHVVFNISGQGTAVLLAVIAAVAVAAGFIFERRSGWCAGLCPVHPVEKLYGSGVAFSVPNTNCSDCRCCSLPCADWTVGGDMATSSGSVSSKISEVLMAGAFAGYIWGFFRRPDYFVLSGWLSVIDLYAWPTIGAAATASIYLVVRHVAGPRNRALVLRFGVAATVSTYYLYRLPQLFGFNPLRNNGALVDLTPYLPPWGMLALNLVTTAFFFF